MIDDARPDPDALLAQWRADPARVQRGKLRIYLGASAGVGKTWAMLSAAQREHAAGRDLMVGVVETHGRSETAALLAGLGVLPLRQISHRGRTLGELDLDAALARRPAVLLVDELAHANAPGSRHAKRWQDVQELQAAGIEVWSALNVQHLESLNGTVGAITGVRVHETVPDTVFDEAEEVVLVDVTPDELMARLAAGKVHLPQQAERAAQDFFRKGNLIALREIALRRTAEHVEDDVRGWRIEQSGPQGDAGPPAWNTSGALLAAGRAEPRRGWARWWPSAGVVRELARQAPAVNLVEVARADSEQAEEADPRRPRWPGYAWAAAAACAITLLATPLAGVLEPSNIVMLFLLGVVGVAMRFGRGPAAFSALLNVAAFDFFFVSPRLSLAVSDVQYLVTFGVMLGVGLLVGQLTAGLRFAAGVSTSRERRARSLFELTRELSAALESAQVAALGAAAVKGHFGGSALVLLADASDRLVVPETAPPGFDASVADWCFRQGQPAGLGTATLAAQAWHYVPLRAPMRVRGVLALAPAEPRWLLIPEQAQQLDTLARQIAIALERVHYVEVAQNAVVEIESERLRNALLGAISHDVRTPLTALIALAESLQALPEGTQAQHAAARAIVAQAHQLHALVSNLLDMARLESGIGGGSVKLRRDWQSVEEVVGSAIRAARPALGDREVRALLPADLPLVEFDAVLIERVLVNLLENAAKYGAAPIELAAHATGSALVLRVRDHGPGLPAALRGREQTLFDKFTRGQSESATPGVGLGLAICKAVVSAHGGEITAANAPGGGAEFTVTLPRREPPDPAEAIV
ncbi:DUF4118 domain-containing protein [Variovorax saccharolyticus]|uniref:DUF4118 domain-containing protein n=1 Tax=Variovorax saccharolyticus TaxID=3053516 RepID=UPI002577ADEC|nr:DUF4118 domain-containing protein [Variovorax sp. J22R187]MDM0021994.1 DUF4118 domain-containing protein [Variovorax sp. J22R187]